MMIFHRRWNNNCRTLFYFNPLKTRHPKTGTFANVAFYQGMHCLPRQNHSSEWPLNIYAMNHTGPQIRVRNQKLIFLFLKQNIHCGCSKEPSHWDSPFEHSKQILKLIDKKIFTILCWKFLPIWTYDHPDLTVSNFMENYIDPKKVKIERE